MCFFCLQDIVWIRQCFKDLGMERSLFMIVHIDIRSAHMFVKNPVLHRRSMHIDITFYWIQDMVGTSRKVELADVPTTEDGGTDLQTKILRSEVFGIKYSVLLLVS